MWKFMRGKGHQPSAERAKLQKELFQFNKTVQHGFPNRPSALAWDPKLKLMAIGTRTGVVKVFCSCESSLFACEGDLNGACLAKPSAPDFMKAGFGSPLQWTAAQGRLISLCDDNTLHLWELNCVDGKPKMDEVKSCSLEGRLKKISTCCLQSNGDNLLIGTEGGNIYLLDVKSFEMTDHIIYQDVVMQKMPARVPDDYKVNPGAVEAIAEHPSDPNKILIGYNRGLMVLWDNKQLNADQTYVGSQQLESVSWQRKGNEFMSAHNDGSYIVWSTADSTKPEQAAHTPYGPFPCKAVNKIDWKSAKRGDFIVFSGGMPRASFGDRHTVTAISGDKHVVFELTSRVIDFFTVSDTTEDHEFDDPHSLVVLAEEEMIVVDLESEEWPCFKPPYLASLHSSAITCAQHCSNVPKELWEKIVTAGEQQAKDAYSQREWPINGGKNLLTEAPTSQDLLLTGHEDGTIRFWNATGVSLYPLYKLTTSNIFSGEDAAEQNAVEEEEWPPFRKVGSFDPYSDDPRLAIKKIVLCTMSGTLVVAGTAGQVVVFSMGDTEIDKALEVSTINIVGDRDSFVWKGHDQLTVKAGSLKFGVGFQPNSLLQILPPAACTALSLHADWGLVAAGTAHGFGLFDYIQKKQVMVKCTLNPNAPPSGDKDRSDSSSAASDDQSIASSTPSSVGTCSDITGVGENTMSRRKSFKKSLRESFRRLRKGRSQRVGDKKKGSASPRQQSIEEKKESEDSSTPGGGGLVAVADRVCPRNVMPVVQTDIGETNRSNHLLQSAKVELEGVEVEPQNVWVKNDVVPISPIIGLWKESPRTGAKSCEKSIPLEDSRGSKSGSWVPLGDGCCPFRCCFPNQLESMEEEMTIESTQSCLWCGRCHRLLSFFGIMKSFFPVTKSSSSVVSSPPMSAEAASFTDEIFLVKLSTLSDSSYARSSCRPISETASPTQLVPLAEGETSEGPSFWDEETSVEESAVAEPPNSTSGVIVADLTESESCVESSQALDLHNVNLPYCDLTASTFGSDLSFFPPVASTPPVATSTPKWRHDRILPFSIDAPSIPSIHNQTSLLYRDTLERMTLKSVLSTPESFRIHRCIASLKSTLRTSNMYHNRSVPSSSALCFFSPPLLQRHWSRSSGLLMSKNASSLPAVNPQQLRESHVTVTSMFRCSSNKEAPVTDLDAPTPPQQQEQPQTCSLPPTASPEAKPVERQVEARTSDDSLGSMVRCLYLASSFIVSVANTTPTLWAGTNSGAIYVFTVSLPSNEKRKDTQVNCQLGKEIQLKHRAPVIAICIIDASNNPLPEPMEVQREVAKQPDNAGYHRVVICSEEQFKVFTLPSLKPYCKFKLTAHEGSRVRKIGFVRFTSRSDANHSEHCITCLTNQGDLSIFSIPDLRRQLVHPCIKREDINGISSLVFTRFGEGFFLHSSSELQRFSLSARIVTDVACELELPEGSRPVPEPQPEEREIVAPPVTPVPVIAAAPLEADNTKDVPLADADVDADAEEAETDDKKEDQQTEVNEVSVMSEDSKKGDESTGDITIDSIKDHLQTSTTEESHYTITERREEVKEVKEVQQSVVTIQTTTILTAETNTNANSNAIIVSEDEMDAPVSPATNVPAVPATSTPTEATNGAPPGQHSNFHLCYRD